MMTTDEYIKKLNKETEETLKEMNKICDDLSHFYKTGDASGVEYLGIKQKPAKPRTGRCGNPVMPLQ